ncbi:MAG: hypothetical protein GXY32_10635, partial [Ruminococcaceae bacterium]|nr:hypothetical protein [Oscillospiraceae bacterium]
MKTTGKKLLAILLCTLMLLTLLPAQALAAEPDSAVSDISGSLPQEATDDESVPPASEPPLAEGEAPVADVEAPEVDTEEAPANASEAEAMPAETGGKIVLTELRFAYGNATYEINAVDTGPYDTTLTVEGTTATRAGAADYKTGMKLYYYAMCDGAPVDEITLQAGQTKWYDKGDMRVGGESFQYLAEGVDYTTVEDPDYHIWKFSYYGRYDNAIYCNFTLRVRKHQMEYAPTYANSLYAGKDSLWSDHMFGLVSSSKFTKVAGKDNFYEYVFAEDVTFPYVIRILCNNYYKNDCYINGVEFTAAEYAKGKDFYYQFTAEKPYIDFYFVPGDDTHTEYVTKLPTTWRIRVIGTGGSDPGTPDPGTPDPGAPDTDKVAADKAALSKESITASSGTGKMTLPTTGANGSAIVWASDNAAVIDPATGAITRPAAGA